MFETSVVNAQANAAPRRIGLFTVSLIAHTAVILGVAAVSIASVDFPDVAPDEFATAPIFMPVTVPPPLGNPNGGAPPKPAVTPPQRQETPPAPPTQITAPPAIPNDVPVLDAPSPGDSTSTATGPATGTGTVPGPIGVRDGDPNPISLDIPVVNVPAPVENKVYVVGGEIKAPVAIYKTQPPYPSSMIRNRIPATVAIRCIIDKNGNVRDPQIVKGAMPPFNDAVIKSVLQWRFQPGSYRGQAVETYLDLTVTFQVH